MRCRRGDHQRMVDHRVASSLTSHSAAAEVVRSLQYRVPSRSLCARITPAPVDRHHLRRSQARPALRSPGSRAPHRWCCAHREGQSKTFGERRRIGSVVKGRPRRLQLAAKLVRELLENQRCALAMGALGGDERQQHHASAVSSTTAWSCRRPRRSSTRAPAGERVLAPRSSKTATSQQTPHSTLPGSTSILRRRRRSSGNLLEEHLAGSRNWPPQPAYEPVLFTGPWSLVKGGSQYDRRSPAT